jgi:hypothetical protein
MSAGAVIAIIVAIAASGVLMMRFRKRWLAKINIAFTNRITWLFAGWLTGFGILTHVGRKSGKVYRTPINVFRATNGFVITATTGEYIRTFAALPFINDSGLGLEFNAASSVHLPQSGNSGLASSTRRRCQISYASTS